MDIPRHRWFMKVYQLDVISGLDYELAELTSITGDILKIYSTKKIVNMLAGFSRGTANWATNVGNEHNLVLMSVITEGEGEGLRKMLNGIVCRYRDASIPPPKVLYTDRDCCGRQNVKKYFEAAWPFLQISHNFSEVAGNTIKHGLLPQPISTKFISDEDKLILEDELQRIVLVGSIKAETTVTGVIVAVYGKEPEDDKGKFHVEDYCFQDLPAQKPLPQLSEDRYVAFVSGLDFGPKQEQQFGLQMFVDMVMGQLGDMGQQEGATNIVGVVVAGNCLSQDTQSKDSLTKAKYLQKKTVAGSVEAIRDLDNCLVELASGVEVILMPGEYDPSNFTLPQQAFHKCMFQQAARYSTLRCSTNPLDCSLEGVRLLGSSGQPVDDIFRYSAFEEPLTILENILKWGHMAPTAPDTLGCYPFYDTDPFILNECPHILFAGNQKSFKSKLHEGPDGQKVLLVTVPMFSKTSTVVLVNLRNLEALPMVFSSEIGEDSESMDTSGGDK